MQGKWDETRFFHFSFSNKQVQAGVVCILMSQAKLG